MISAKCDEQLLRGDVSAMQKVDTETVQAELMSTNYLVPSFHTLFRDPRYLYACANSLRCVLGTPEGKERTTITSCPRACFQPERENGGEYSIEGPNGTFSIRQATPDAQFELGRRIMWLFAMREYRDMERPKKIRRTRLAKPVIQEADEWLVWALATLAYRLGFRNVCVQELKRRLSASEVAPAAAHAIQCPNNSLIWQDAIETKRRCGYPTKEEYEYDKHFLFLDNIEAELPFQAVTSFFVRRCVFLAIFSDATCQNVAGRAASPLLLTEYPGHIEGPISTAGMSHEKQTSADTFTNKEGEDYQAQHEQGTTEDRAPLKPEQTATTSIPRDSRKPLITFVVREKGEWKIVQHVSCDDPRSVEETGKTWMIQGMRPFSATMPMQPLLPGQFFKAAMASAGRVLILMPEDILL
ncbi:hypothetical protein F5Y17DRAFT_453355 [Xylariaceae sp. FL0594]|nr:hypothetical protein F5Y17DRAFT_453355 [Xylariaceae sp. FL0594]